ncbi:hypothetical protein [Kaarinaea lacus]
MDRRSGTQNQVTGRISGFFVILLLLASSAGAEDRLELDSISIKGSRELPKVLYIVPWKSARLGAFEASAGGSTLDTEMEALDRDVFRRQVEYFGMLFGEGKAATNR